MREQKKTTQKDTSHDEQEEGFDELSLRYRVIAQRWYNFLIAGIFALGVVILFNIPLIALIEQEVNISPSEAQIPFEMRYYGSVGAIAVLLSYWIGVCTRRFRTYSNLVTIYEHRAKLMEILETLYNRDDFDSHERATISKEAARSIFAEIPKEILVPKGQKSQEGPVHQITNNIPESKK